MKKSQSKFHPPAMHAQACMHAHHSQHCPLLLPVSAHSWKELPAEVMAAILQFAPHKRTDVKLVCQAWRAAVNAQITSVGMTAAELPCLQMLPAVQALVVRGTSKGAVVCRPESGGQVI